MNALSVERQPGIRWWVPRARDLIIEIFDAHIERMRGFAVSAENSRTEPEDVPRPLRQSAMISR